MIFLRLKIITPETINVWLKLLKNEKKYGTYNILLSEASLSAVLVSR